VISPPLIPDNAMRFLVCEAIKTSSTATVDTRSGLLLHMNAVQGTRLLLLLLLLNVLLLHLLVH
jgi:hypothetical protein